MTATENEIIKRFEDAQNSLVLQSSDLSLETISKMVDSGAIDVSPQYQRRDRWELKAQAELIESFLLNVPVPPVYLAEDDFGTYTVIDGKQRITSINRFLRDKFILDNLTGFPQVNKLKFSALPKPLQNALSIRPYLRVVTLLKQTDSELKYEVFTRLNTGGKPLLPQEIRNALYRGAFNDLLFELGEEKFLREQLKINTKKESAFKEMQDVEMVLRFFTYRESWKTFSGDIRKSMDDFMKNQMKPKKATITAFRDEFKDTLERCKKLWGDNAFKRHTDSGFRSQFLAAIYDAQMIAAHNLSTPKFNKLCTKQNLVITETINLFKDKKFEESVRSSTNTPVRVRYRISKIIDMLNSI